MTGKSGLSGSALKILAVISMVIDHVGAVLVERIIRTLSEEGEKTYCAASLLSLEQWIWCDRILRGIGRIAFPLFCFLLVEGFIHTRDWRRYAGRLFLFAVLSEIPFDLAISGQWWDPKSQNVFFTLGIAVLVMAAFAWAEGQVSWKVRTRRGCQCVFLLLGMAAAQMIFTDYAAMGVLCVLVLYDTRTNRGWQMAAGMLSFLWEPPALLAFWPIAYYNGDRGISWKYVFYLFYPIHLLILYLITMVQY